MFLVDIWLIIYFSGYVWIAGQILLILRDFKNEYGWYILSFVLIDFKCKSYYKSQILFFDTKSN